MKLSLLILRWKRSLGSTAVTKDFCSHANLQTKMMQSLKLSKKNGEPWVLLLLSLAKVKSSAKSLFYTPRMLLATLRMLEFSNLLSILQITSTNLSNLLRRPNKEMTQEAKKRLERLTILIFWMRRLS